jgi:hypothetical protein
LKFERAFLRTITEYFVKWAYDVFNYDVEEEDEKKINEAQYPY